MPKASYVNVYVSINVKDYQRWMTAVKRLEDELSFTVSEYNRINAVKYRNLVIQNIHTQKYGPDYEPLSESYASWKQKHGFPLSFWILKGDVLKNIVVQRSGTAQTDWESGPDPVALDTGGKNWSLTGPPKRIAKYSGWVEEGTRNMPPRPLFTPSAYEYQVTYWQREADRVLKKIESKWR